MWNYEAGTQEILDASDVYADIIYPGRTVTIVGPSDSPFRDPSSLLVGHLVGPNGKVYIADPNESYVPQPYSRGGPVLQCGSVTNFLNVIDMFRNAGLPLPVYEWLEQDSGIFHIPKHSDYIVDHGTSQYILEVVRDMRGRMADSLIWIAQTYKGALHDGGTLIWQVNSDAATRWGLSKNDYLRAIHGTLITAGYKSVDYFPVAEVYRIPVPDESFQQVRTIRAPSGGTVDDCGWYMHDGSLLIGNPHHNCPDMFVARK